MNAETINDNNSQVNNEIKNKFQCHECEKNFSNKSNLKTHIKSIHENIKNYVCEDCKKCFTNNTRLKSHIEKKHNEKKESKKKYVKSRKTFNKEKNYQSYEKNEKIKTNKICEYCNQEIKSEDFELHQNLCEFKPNNVII